MGILLKSVNYNKENTEWISTDKVPDNSREILLQIEEFGTTSGYYMVDEECWYCYKYRCLCNPTCWREMPRYDCSSSIR